MAKIMTVKEALNELKCKTNAKGEKVPNRFSKKSFNNLLVALANDETFKTKVGKTVKGEVVFEEVVLSKEFRKWCKRLVEKAGVDPSESERVLSTTFVIDNMEGIYEFFMAAIYEYMEAGNKFDFPMKDGFNATISIKDVAPSEKVTKAYNPIDRSLVGEFKVKKKKHKILRAKSSCPKYLIDKVKIK